MYNVRINHQAIKELKHISLELRKKIYNRIKSLSTEPRPKGVRKIHSEEGLWRIRIGKYRVIYFIDDELKQVEVLYVRKREEAYK